MYCQTTDNHFSNSRGKKMFDPRYFVRFDFVVCKTITNVPFYCGKHLNAMFKVMFHSYFKELSESKILFQLNVKTIPLGNGSRQMTAGENVNIVLSFPPCYKDTVHNIITTLQNRNFERYTFPLSSHFNPEKTINFKRAICCRCNLEWTLDCQPIFDADLQPAINQLIRKREFTLQFHTPLRLTRLEGDKAEYHYFNHEYFDTEHFLTRLLGDDPHTNLKMIDKYFTWIDFTSRIDQSYKDNLSLGGICGYATFKGKLDLDLAKFLVYGQYNGIGKSTTIGFGFYSILELKDQNKIFYPSKPSLLEKIVTPKNLYQTLSKMNNHSPGPDGITVEDLKEISDEYLQILAKLIHEKKFKRSETIEYKKIKYNHQIRKISISNMTDRLIAKLLSDGLSKIFDPILSEQAYAYRLGRSVQQAVREVQNNLKLGFCHVIKADITDFFPSIQTDKLFKLLNVLLHNDELVTLVEILYSDYKGLTQGNPLSPLLSNIYMKVFDDLICSKHHRYIRFADDMLIMVKEAAEIDGLLQKMRRFLQILDLELNEEKTEIFRDVDKIEFLGQRISKFRLQKIPTEKAEIQESYQWLPVFNYNYRKGIAVYVTFKTHMVRTEDTNLIIHKEDDSRESVPWSQINRFVVVGRARISAGAIRKALYYGLPVSFLSVMGKNIGSFHPNNRLYNVKDIYNPLFHSFKEFQLSFVQSIVQTKIHNQKMILSRSKISEPKLFNYKNKILQLTDIDEIRGYEGAASNLYFQYIRELVKPFSFEKREYHPAVGPVNVMLSIGYSLIYNRIGEALISNGLNPYYGIYHFPRGRHMALASDLVECFRFIAERVMLSLIHLKKLTPDDFVEVTGIKSSYTKLSGEGFKAYLHRFEWMMNQEIKLQDSNKPVKYAQLFDLMINRLIRAMRLGIDFKPIRIR